MILTKGQSILVQYPSYAFWIKASKAGLKHSVELWIGHSAWSAMLVASFLSLGVVGWGACFGPPPGWRRARRFRHGFRRRLRCRLRCLGRGLGPPPLFLGDDPP